MTRRTLAPTTLPCQRRRSTIAASCARAGRPASPRLARARGVQQPRHQRRHQRQRERERGAAEPPRETALLRGRAAPGLRRERNGFVLGCAESTVVQLTSSSSSAARYGVRLVQEAKECVDDDYVRSMVELLEERRGAAPGRTWWRAAW
jgi:hypothetical protein